MTITIRPVWLGVNAELRRTGPYDIYFEPSPDSREAHHSTGYRHFVFWNGFPIHTEPCAGYNEMRWLIEAWETHLHDPSGPQQAR